MRLLARIVVGVLGRRVLGSLEYFFRPERAFQSGGPFNGQQARARLIDELLGCREWKAVVETGTFRGETTEYMARSGLPVHSVESNHRYYAFARLRLRGLRDRVHVHLGDSRSWLQRFAADGKFPRTGVLFYLDAHWYDDLPLLDELSFVFSNWPDAVAVVDDFEVPGTTYGFEDYGAGNALRGEYLAPLAHLQLRGYGPTTPAEEETGHRRGCVVLCRDASTARALDRVTSLYQHPPAWTHGAK